LPTHAEGSRKAGKLANRQATFRSLLFLVKWKINFQTISFVDGFDWLFFLEAASEVSLCSLPILLSFILFYSPRPRFPAYKWQINSLVAQISWMQSSGSGEAGSVENALLRIRIALKWFMHFQIIIINPKGAASQQQHQNQQKQLGQQWKAELSKCHLGFCLDGNHLNLS